MSAGNPEIGDDETARAHRALRAVWVIVSAFHRDAVADEVADMGHRLRAAMDRRDRREAAAVLREVRTWLTTRAGVVNARLCEIFELDDGSAE